jgi:UDP-N-acetylglucosamine:LPS N-acetylglucosamine transferase
MSDIRYALKGDRTFLWDFPEFMPLPEHSKCTHVGPIELSQWPYDPFDINGFVSNRYPLAIVSFGTCVTDAAITERITGILLGLGFCVLIAAGGQKEMLEIMPNEPRVKVCHFAPLSRIYPHASLLITHGGQMTVFEALQNKIPVAVMPFQPEQAHNGVCLERIDCGCRLVPSMHFNGDSSVYVEAFARMADEDITAKIDELCSSLRVHENLGRIKDDMSRYGGTDSLVRLLGEL